MKTRRSLLVHLAAAGLAAASLLVPLASAGRGTERVTSLEALLEGQKPATAVVSYVEQGGHRVLEARVWNLRALTASLVLGDTSHAVELDPRTRSGRLVLDTRRGDRVPQASPRDLVTIEVDRREILSGVLRPTR